MQKKKFATGSKNIKVQSSQTTQYSEQKPNQPVMPTKKVAVSKYNPNKQVGYQMRGARKALKSQGKM